MVVLSFKNGGLKENWFALYLAIKKNKTSIQALKELGIKTPNEKISVSRKNSKNYVRKKTVNIDVKKVRKLYEEGHSIRSLSNMFKVSYTSIRVRLIEDGCKIRPRSSYNNKF